MVSVLEDDGEDVPDSDADAVIVDDGVPDSELVDDPLRVIDKVCDSEPEAVEVIVKVLLVLKLTVEETDDVAE